jgi:uncharacterized protein (TIGR03067 family)
VHGIEGQIEKEGPARVLRFNESDRFARQQVRAVTFVPAHLVVAVPVEAAIAYVAEIVDGAVVMAVLVVEAASRGQGGRIKMTQVPFATNAFVPADGDLKGEKVLGIYALDKEELKLCISDRKNGERPKEFVSRDGTTLLVCKREKK